MIYYPIKKIDTYSIHSKLKHYICSETEENILLTQYGMFKYINDELMVCKLNQEENKDNIIKKYIEGIDFIVTANKWCKTNKRYQIPFVNETVKIKTLKYTPRKKSKFKFVVEKLNNLSVDYYIESTEKYDNHSLQEDIRSFLDELK